MPGMHKTVHHILIAALLMAGPSAMAVLKPGSTYTVKPGDTLNRLSKFTGFTVTELQRAAQLPDSSALRAGQQITLPSGNGDRRAAPGGAAIPSNLAQQIDSITREAQGRGELPIGRIIAPTRMPGGTSIQAASQRSSNTSIEGMSFQFQGMNACGPQSVSSVLSHFGVRRSQAQMARAIGQQGRYTSLGQLASQLEAAGLRTAIVEHATLAQAARLVRAGIPPIVLQRMSLPGSTDHFRVVRGITQTHVLLLDPYYGPDVALSQPDFQALWNVQGRHMLVAYPSRLEAQAKAALRG